MSDNAASIIKQFSKQAIHFAEMPGHNDDQALTHIAEFARLSPDDEVLDVACGSGIVARSFARTASRVVGMDLTPAMLAEAGRLAEMDGLKNVEWCRGDVENLPWPDGTYSLVVSRYAFHHITNQARVLSEMVRVARPGGRLVLVDPVLPREQVDAYDEFERLIDASHSGVLIVDELQEMLRESRLVNLRFSFYRMEMGLERHLATSFPGEGNAEKVSASEEGYRGRSAWNCGSLAW